eukprot:TRINITY_DN1359_c0_g5_i1.p1 TRINITY_DN1359_c0_g5~~TRINITY_DN1359_c0_g5_i1.p1  ORF type:complete len:860 (+),score=172.66 TRINITY_DN1359_c0_g5_i1:146-2725(+)
MLQFARLNVKTVLLHKSFASSAKSTHEVLEDVAKRLNVKHWEDWYQVSKQRLLFHQVYPSMSRSSFVSTIMSAYPERPWKEWRFDKVPPGFWDQEVNVRRYLDWLSQEFHIRDAEEWNTITERDVIAKGGGALISKYGNFKKVLSAFYPEVNKQKTGSPTLRWKAQSLLLERLREILPSEHHGDVLFDYLHPDIKYLKGTKRVQLDVYIPSCKLAFEYQGHQHYRTSNYFGEAGEVQKLDEQKARACEEKGITLVHVPFWWDQTRESLQSTLHQKRPDLVRNSADHPPIPETYEEFKSSELRAEMDKIKSKLSITEPYDWLVCLRLPLDDSLRDIIRKYGSLEKALRIAYPQTPWEFMSARSTSSKPEQRIEEILRRRFADLEVKHKHPNLVHTTGITMKFDFWVPSEKIALEYQGEQHYQQLLQSDEKFQRQIARDVEKRLACQRAGIKLIEIPYWWSESDILLEQNIHGAISSGVQMQTPKNISEAGRLMLPTSFSNKLDYRGWLLSEYREGLRVLWNGKDFLGISGKIMIAAQDFKEDMPDMILDGYLRNAQGGTDIHFGDWNNLVFQVIDAPQLDLPLDKRLQFLRNELKTNSHLQMMQTSDCFGEMQLMNQLVVSIEQGADGLVVRKPSSRYVSGKSLDFKLAKPNYLDVGVVLESQTREVALRYLSLTTGHSVGLRGRISESIDLSRDSIILVKSQTVRPDGKFAAPYFCASLPNVTKNTVFHYVATIGNPIGVLETQTSCSNCNRILGKDEVRVQVKGVRQTAGRNVPFRVISFCPKIDCIGKSKEGRFPSFDNRIAVGNTLHYHVASNKKVSGQWKEFAEALNREGIQIVEARDGVFVNESLYFLGSEFEK